MDTKEEECGEPDVLSIQLFTGETTCEALQDTVLPLIGYLQDNGWRLAQLDTRFDDYTDGHGQAILHFTRPSPEKPSTEAAHDKEALDGITRIPQ